MAVDLIPRKRTSLFYHMYGTIERLTQASTYQYNNFLLWVNFRKLIQKRWSSKVYNLY